MKKFIIMVTILMFPIQAMAGIFTDEAPIVLKFIEQFLSPLALGWVSVIGSILFGVMVTARALSEILALFADKTKTDIDNKAIYVLGRIFEITSKIVGWFAIGTPSIFKGQK